MFLVCAAPLALGQNIVMAPFHFQKNIGAIRAMLRKLAESQTPQMLQNSQKNLTNLNNIFECFVDTRMQRSALKIK